MVALPAAGVSEIKTMPCSSIDCVNVGAVFALANRLPGAIELIFSTFGSKRSVTKAMPSGASDFNWTATSRFSPTFSSSLPESSASSMTLDSESFTFAVATFPSADSEAICCRLTMPILAFGGNGAVVWAETRVPSGLTALLVAMVPIWMLVLHVALDALRAELAHVVRIGRIALDLRDHAVLDVHEDPAGVQAHLADALDPAILRRFFPRRPSSAPEYRRHRHLALRFGSGMERP